MIFVLIILIIFFSSYTILGLSFTEILYIYLGFMGIMFLFFGKKMIGKLRKIKDVIHKVSTSNRRDKTNIDVANSQMSDLMKKESTARDYISKLIEVKQNLNKTNNELKNKNQK